MEKNICYFDAAKENSEAGLNPISFFFSYLLLFYQFCFATTIPCSFAFR